MLLHLLPGACLLRHPRRQAAVRVERRRRPGTALPGGAQGGIGHGAYHDATSSFAGDVTEQEPGGAAAGVISSGSGFDRRPRSATT